MERKFLFLLDRKYLFQREQRYVHYIMESAQYLYTDISKMNNFFNWTMTYRRDSDFYRPYGRIVKIKSHPEGAELEEYIKKFGRENKYLAKDKKKQAAWFVSHCATQVKLLFFHFPIENSINFLLETLHLPVQTIN